eukprot:COSAG03_NODE_3053_length_2263_cov_11.646488_2_plen_149_part_00
MHLLCAARIRTAPRGQRTRGTQGAGLSFRTPRCCLVALACAHTQSLHTRRRAGRGQRRAQEGRARARKKYRRGSSPQCCTHVTMIRRLRAIGAQLAPQHHTIRSEGVRRAPPVDLTRIYSTTQLTAQGQPAYVHVYMCQHMYLCRRAR